MLRALFEREPAMAAYKVLLGCASRLGDQEAKRDWALGRARHLSTRVGNGALFVELALAEGGLEAACEVADKRSYRTVGATLQTMRSLSAAAGTVLYCTDAEIREIRTTHKRRPGLMAERDRAQLST